VVGLAIAAILPLVIIVAMLWLLWPRSGPDVTEAKQGAERDGAVQAGKRPRPVPGPKLDKTLTVALQANDLAYDPGRGCLYAAVGNTAPNHANTVTALKPATGAVLWSVNVGNDPAVLALSDDGRALWVGLGGAAAIQRVDLTTRQAGPQHPLGNGGFGPSFVEQMQVLPGTTDTVVASLQRHGVSPRHDGVAVYDNGVRRPNKTQDHTGANRIACSDDPHVVYGYNNETTEFGLRRLEVDANGVREAQVFGGVIQGFNVGIAYAGGRIYGSTGAVVDAKGGVLAGTIPAGGSVTVDAAAKRAYYLVQDRRSIEAYDTETLMRKASCAVPEAGNGLTQVGGTALAFRTERQIILVPLRDLK
jgi:DNA-binding beta-propeller fold protein YncE